MEQSGNHEIRWLLIEGLLPLFGAGVLYLIWGTARYVMAARGSFNFAWKEALDPYGWLYGGGIIAFQSMTKSLSDQGWSIVSIFLLIEGAACVILLLAAMTQRGEDADWKPTTFATKVAGFLVIAILVEGFLVYHRS
jgi:hypothetical protein